jgi:hypothetical protein
VPDLAFAVASPIRIVDDTLVAQRVFDLLPQVPTLVWGRDERSTGDMWSCNSVISWTLATAGVDVDSIPMPPRARAPGWHAGLTVATPALTGSGSGQPWRVRPRSSDQTIPIPMSTLRH